MITVYSPAVVREVDGVPMRASAIGWWMQDNQVYGKIDTSYDGDNSTAVIDIPDNQVIIAACIENGWQYEQ